ncbi:hypothetical protein [Dishui Lake large algae virus 1]|nr:hypothetical protein [Dishui Lake large algae virus 1]
MTEGKNIANWLSKTKKALDTSYNSDKHVTVSIRSFDNIKDKEKEDIRKELVDSSYGLSKEKINAFLDVCHSIHEYTMGIVRISVITNTVSSNLAAQVKRSLYRANAIMDLFGGGFGIGSDKNIKIVLVPIKERRKKPNPTNKIVMPSHINGGYTYTVEQGQDARIFIYRLEEWPKVMLHEIVHNIPKIQNIQWGDSDIRKMYKMFGIDNVGCPDACKTVLEPTEAVVEAWAIFLHTAFLCHETGSNFYELIKKEIVWNDHHTRWILEKQQNGLGGIWREGTHAFSYIVLRGIILHNLNKFLGMRMPYSPTTLERLWEDGWKKLRKNIMSARSEPGAKNKNKNENEKGNSMRMSVYGDL